MITRRKIRQFCFYSFFLIIACALYFPTRHARIYPFIVTESIVADFLVFENSGIVKANLTFCDYRRILQSNEIMQIDKDDDEVTVMAKNDLHISGIEMGGRFTPSSCNPLLRTAIVVPYRNRSKQLPVFLNYMHGFLQRQHIEYVIIVVNQNDTRPFNRAKMLNYGALVAISMAYSCLILHDVDLLPLNSGNLYGCSKQPRHMTCNVDTLRFNLPYLRLFGGANAIRVEHFLKINGMSNMFYGWGGEDDDFYRRLEAHDLLPMRFAPALSAYIMLSHRKEKARATALRNTAQFVTESHRNDGLSNLTSSTYKITLKPLYTLVDAS